MSASNGVHIMGRITRDLELRHTQSGTAVCQFCVAVHREELLKHYDMQDNAEFILLYKLRQIGVDVEKWTAEPQTQKVVLKE